MEVEIEDEVEVEIEMEENFFKGLGTVERGLEIKEDGVWVTFLDVLTKRDDWDGSTGDKGV